MKTLTNLHSIEDAIARAVELDPYEFSGDISVTTLCKPPQMTALEHQHADELTEDVSDRLWSLLGQAVHVILDRGAGENALTEERLEADVLGWKVSGRPDLWRQTGWDGTTFKAGEGELIDYKVTSVYSFLLGDKPEWTAQVNMYAALYRRHGFPVTKLTIAAILRDHQKSKSLSDPNYPKIPFLRADVPCWPAEEAERFLEERVRLHQRARGKHYAFSVGEGEEGASTFLVTEPEYPPCTDEERWARADSWAVMKEGRKSAVRVLDTPEAAERVLGSEQRTGRGSYSIQYRPGKNTRCEDGYCQVVKWCSQARSLGIERSSE